MSLRRKREWKRRQGNGEEGNSKGTEMGLSIFKLGKMMKKKKRGNLVGRKIRVVLICALGQSEKLTLASVYFKSNC